MSELAADTAVTGHDGEYRGMISPDWGVWGPGGGYVASIALRAAGAHSQFARPASIACHFLRAAEFEDVGIAVTTLRSSKRVESVQVVLSQQGKAVLVALVWAADQLPGIDYCEAPMPAVPGPDRVPSLHERRAASGLEPSTSTFNDRVDIRLLLWDDFDSRPPTPPVNCSWYRFLSWSATDDPWLEACRGLTLCEHAVGYAATRRVQGAPSTELSVHFHRLRPGSEWFLARAEATSAADGLIGARTDVWADDGTLVASSMSQLLCPISSG